MTQRLDCSVRRIRRIAYQKDDVRPPPQMPARKPPLVFNDDEHAPPRSAPVVQEHAMRPVDNRMSFWLDVLADVLQKPLTTLPRAAIMAAFEESYDVTGVGCRWSDARGFGVELTRGLAGSFSPGALAEPEALALVPKHGLVRWFKTTRNPAAQTLSRVPTSISPQADRAAVQEFLAPARCEELMAIPYHWAWPHYRAFVLARGESDFTSDDLWIARRVQRVLCSLETQVRILREARYLTPLSEEYGASEGLSGRELAVLHLLARGLTAQGIGRHLGASPRTIQKHLQHIYQKLGVNDRMAAVRVASARRLLVESQSLRSSPTGSGSGETP